MHSWLQLLMPTFLLYVHYGQFDIGTDSLFRMSLTLRMFALITHTYIQIYIAPILCSIWFTVRLIGHNWFNLEATNSNASDARVT